MKIGRSEAIERMEALGFPNVVRWNPKRMRSKIAAVVQLSKDGDLEILDDEETTAWVEALVKASNDGEEIKVVLDGDIDGVGDPVAVEGGGSETDAGDEPVDEGPEDLDGGVEEPPKSEEGASDESVDESAKPKAEGKKKGRRGRKKRKTPESEAEKREDGSFYRVRLTIADAKDLLGWVEETAEKPFGTEYLLKDADKTKIRCSFNLRNRPFRLAMAKRWSSELLRRKWQYNGQSIIVLDNGQIGSGQHRLIGLVLAEQIRSLDLGKWGKDPIVMDTLVVRGVPSDKETVDTIDLGQKRGLGDVFYCNREAVGLKRDADRKRMTNVLAGAVRIVWLRAGGKRVSDAPHFPHSEALDFLELHPGIRDAVELIGRLDKLGGEKRCIGGFVSLPYAVGTAYLMSDAKTPEVTEKFWTAFADGSETLHSLRLALQNVGTSSGSGRDRVLNLIAKAFHIWAEGKGLQTLKAKDLKLKKDEQVFFNSGVEDQGE